MLHVYAVTDAGHTLPDGLGLRPVRSGAVAAVVGPEPDTEPTEAEVLAHCDVLTALVADGPVLPLRYGTVAPDDDAVRAEVLDPAAAELRDALDAQADVVEVRVTLRFDGPAALRAVLPRDHPRLGPDAPLSDRIALGERLAVAVAQAAAGWADRLLEPAGGLARATTELDAPEPAEVRRALLVGCDRLSEVDDGVHRLPMGPVPCAVEYVGPLPPVDFPAARLPGDGGSRWGW